VKTTIHRAFWNSTAVELERELHSGAGGLSSEEASARLARHGYNRFRRDRPRPLILLFLARFKSPLVVLLLGANIVIALTGDVWGCSVIRTAGNPWRSRPSPWLIAASVGVIVAAFVLTYSPLGRIFGFVALPLTTIGALGLVVVVYLALAQRVKSWLLRREASTSGNLSARAAAG
jgi:magnesium-transporting ATPase (P-type)